MPNEFLLLAPQLAQSYTQLPAALLPGSYTQAGTPEITASTVSLGGAR